MNKLYKHIINYVLDFCRRYYLYSLFWWSDFFSDNNYNIEGLGDFITLLNPIEPQ